MELLGEQQEGFCKGNWPKRGIELASSVPGQPPPASAKLLKIFQWIREGCEFGWGLRAKGHHEIWVVKPFCGAWGSVREGKKVYTQKTMYLFL